MTQKTRRSTIPETDQNGESSDSNGLWCPYCFKVCKATVGKVLPVRGNSIGAQRRPRIYRCPNGHAFRTTETVDMPSKQKPPAIEIQIKKRSENKGWEPFDVEKLEGGLWKARTSGIDVDEMKEIVDRTLEILFDENETKPFCGTEFFRGYEAAAVGHACLRALFEGGYPAAWMRFALKHYNKDTEGEESDFDGVQAFLKCKYEEFYRKYGRQE